MIHSFLFGAGLQLTHDLLQLARWIIVCSDKLWHCLDVSVTATAPPSCPPIIHALITHDENFKDLACSCWLRVQELLRQMFFNKDFWSKLHRRVEADGQAVEESRPCWDWSPISQCVEMQRKDDVPCINIGESSQWGLLHGETQAARWIGCDRRPKARKDRGSTCQGARWVDRTTWCVTSFYCHWLRSYIGRR